MLDGGSYCVDLIEAEGEPIHLFIAHPGRRKTSEETISVLDERQERKEFVLRESDLGKKLHGEVKAALGGGACACGRESDSSDAGSAFE